MPEAEKKGPPKKLTPADVLKGESPLVLTATLEPIVGDRFQPAGFPEIGHVIYRAPRQDGSTEDVCIVDSAASMANHLETVCQRGAHDLDLVDELSGMPYIRCVTGDLVDGKLPNDKRETVVTSLTEGHRIASSYFLDGSALTNDGTKGDATWKEDLKTKFGLVLANDKKKAHPPPAQWWNVFTSIFHLDPNSLVHGVLFPQWQIKIARTLTAHLEAFGAARVDRSGVKFDRLGKTTSGQPIFAIDDATAESIRATFVLDVSLIRSFGRKKKGGDKETQLGLADKQQEFLVALALWKIQRLLATPFRFRSGCHLRCTSLKSHGQDVQVDINIAPSINAAGFADSPVTDVFWPRDDLYREGEADGAEPKRTADSDDADENDE